MDNIRIQHKYLKHLGFEINGHANSTMLFNPTVKSGITTSVYYNTKYDVYDICSYDDILASTFEDILEYIYKRFKKAGIESFKVFKRKETIEKILNDS